MELTARRNGFRISSVKHAGPNEHTAKHASVSLEDFHATRRRSAGGSHGPAGRCQGAEGLDVAAAVRVFGHSEFTIQRWLTRAGMHSEALHQHLFRDLVLGHVQFDELRTRLRQKTDLVWLWVALDVQTKIVAAVALGPRTQVLAHRLIHRLQHVLAKDCLPVFSSDGLNMYFYALTAHYGHWLPPEGRKKPQWQVAAGLLYDR